jgi:hypothetical protein
MGRVWLCARAGRHHGAIHLRVLPASSVILSAAPYCNAASTHATGPGALGGPVERDTGLSPGDDHDPYRSISAIHDSVIKDERTLSRLTP